MLTAEEKRIVQRARNLSANKKRWCQGAFAKTRRGEECWADYHRAYKFCSMGALQRAAFTLGHDLQGQGDKSCTAVAGLIG